MKTIACCGQILACWGCLPALSQAQHIFSFVQDETEDILAILELSSLPATHIDVVRFEFTSEGDAVFGLGTDPFDGTQFTSSFGTMDVRSLFGNEYLIRPEFASGPFFSPSSQLFLFATGQDSAQLQTLSISAEINVPLSILTPANERGVWVSVVPEPSGIFLIGCAAIGGVLSVCRRKPRP